MRKLIKVLAVVMVIVLLSDQAVYASGFTDFFTKKSSFSKFWNKSVPNWGRSVYKNQLCPAGHFLKKSVYQDRMHGWAYKKVLLPFGRTFLISDDVKASNAIKAGDFDKAIKLFTEKINDTPIDNILYPHFISDEGPNLAKLYDSRGYAYYKKGNITQAISDWNNAIQVYPKDAYAHAALESVHNGNGN